MTIEQAKEVLENLQAQMDYSEYDAIEVAIEVLEKYLKIEKLMDGVIINPQPNCRPYKHTTRKRIYETMYGIQRIIGKERFAGEESN